MPVKLLFICEGPTEQKLCSELMVRYFADKMFKDNITYGDAVLEKYGQDFKNYGRGEFFNTVLLSPSGGLHGDVIEQLLEHLSAGDFEYALSVWDLIDLSKVNSRKLPKERGVISSDYKKLKNQKHSPHIFASKMEDRVDSYLEHHPFWVDKISNVVKNKIKATYRSYLSVHKTDALLFADICIFFKDYCQNTEKEILKKLGDHEKQNPEKICDSGTWKKIDKYIANHKPFDEFFAQCDYDAIAQKCEHFGSFVLKIEELLKQLLQ